MAISPSSGTQNGVTGWFSVSGSTVTVTVSSTSLWWRVNGTKSGGDHGTYYIKDTKNNVATFIAEDGHNYAFQVCSSSGNWSLGTIFTVSFDSSGGSSGGNEGGSSGVGWGFAAEDIYFGDNCNVRWVPSSETATYRLEFSLGRYSSRTELFVPEATDAAGFYTYTKQTIPVSAATNIPDSTAGVVNVNIIEYSDSGGNNEVSRAVIHFTATLDDSVVPTISSCNISKDNSNNPILDNWGVALAKQTKLCVVANASGVHGSKIVSYTITGDYNITVPANSSGKLEYTGSQINSSGNKSLIITCTDSRGRVSSQEMTNEILFLPYSEPKISKMSIRKETFGDSDPDNDRMAITAVWSHDSVNGYNSSTGKVYYKTTVDSDWAEHPGSIISGSEFLLDRLYLEEYTSYNFKLVVTDTIGSVASMDSFSSTTPVLLDFKAGGDGIGIGKVCESPGMEVSMDATFFREVYIGSRDITLSDYISSISPTFDKIYPVGSVYISVVGTNPGLLFGGIWEQLPGRFLLGAGGNDENTNNNYGSIGVGDLDRPVGEKGGEISHTLTVEEMPEHTHPFKGNAPEWSWASGGNRFALSYEEDGMRDDLVHSVGGSKPHNNMPPYLTVYMWKRVS